MIGEIVSFASGMALLIMGILVMVAYRPGKREGAAAVLGFAIFLGFLSAVGNTLYWQVFGQPAVAFGIVTVEQIRGAGDYADLLFKGSNALSGWLHLYALWLALSRHERRLWSVWQMPFYPRRTSCLRALADILRKPPNAR